MTNPNDLLSGINGPDSITLSIYDTCYYLSVFGSNGQKQAFVRELIEKQHEDGSWGSQFFLLEDRLINTLSVLSLIRGSEFAQESKFVRARQYCLQSVDAMIDHVRKPVASELLIPKLWNEVFGEKDSHRALSRMRQNSERKLCAIPLETVFASPTTLLHSVEVFENYSVPWHKLERFLTQGCLGNSPSSTVCFAKHTRNKSAQEYLRSLFVRFGGGLPVNFPIEIFEINWISYFVGVDDLTNFKQFELYLMENWSDQKGIAWSASFPISDLDDTAVSFLILRSLGHSVSARVFDSFYQKGRVVCFPGETHPSVTHVAHLIEALDVAGELDTDVGVSAITQVKDSFNDGCWVDKWHVSPYYATLQVIKSCFRHLSKDYHQMVLDWLIKTQQASGGWGAQQPTVEETCYATLTLLELHQAFSEGALEKSLLMSAKYLQHNRCDYTELWIDKNLYCPRKIVDAIHYKTLSDLKTYGF